MPEALLLPGETVLLTTRRHAITLVMPLFFILVAGLLALNQICPTTVALRLDGRCPLVVALTAAEAALPFLLEWLTTDFALNNQQVLRLQRSIWLLTRSLELSAIEGLTLRQGILARLLGFGDVVMDSAATEEGRLIFDFVPNPQAVLVRIATAIECAQRARGRMTP